MRLVLENDAPKMDDRLFNRAQSASWIAKTVRGSQRSRAYAIKHQCLKRLHQTGGATCSVDWHRCPGLLSFRSRGGERLHSHENWLYPHHAWRRTIHDNGDA